MIDLNLVNKLRLLKIDSELRSEIKMKPISRYYFLIQTNPGEQFFMFASTAAWLLRKLGKSSEQPHEEDDPNATIAAILNTMKELGINVDFPPHKLKQGYGDQVVFILSALADAALKAENFEWKKPEPLVEDPANECGDQIEDESDMIEEEMEEAYQSSDSDADGAKMQNMDNDGEESSTKMQHRSHVDQESWSLETERVAPQLKVAIASDHADWRSRQNTMLQYKKELAERFKTISSHLTKIESQVSSTLERIESRETLINDQLKPLVQDYGQLSDKLQNISDEFKNVNVGVTQRQEVLNELNSKIDSIKQKTESRGSSINDNSPLVNAKKAVETLNKEIVELNYSICVLMWILTQYSYGFDNRGA